MKAKLEELQKARDFRKQGLSLNEISRRLKVSKSSVSAWVKDIQLSKEQHDILMLSMDNGALLGRGIAGKINKERFKILREEYQKEGAKLAGNKDPDFFSGCMLYWAEGTKSRSSCQITNSDVNMLKYYVEFLKKFFNVKEEDISLTCQYYSSNGLSNLEVENHWLNKLGLPFSCFKKTSVNRTLRTSSKERQERTKYGVVKVSVHDVRIVQMIYGAIQEIAGFKNLEWVS